MFRCKIIEKCNEIIWALVYFMELFIFKVYLVYAYCLAAKSKLVRLVSSVKRVSTNMCASDASFELSDF